MAAHGLTENLATWEAVRTVTGFTGLLVGNGASCAVWAGFAYESLFDVALNVNDTCRLAAADVALFDALETRNFEHVLAGLATARRVTTALGTAVPALAERYTSIQELWGLGDVQRSLAFRRARFLTSRSH